MAAAAVMWSATTASEVHATTAFGLFFLYELKPCRFDDFGGRGRLATPSSTCVARIFRHEPLPGRLPTPRTAVASPAARAERTRRRGPCELLWWG